MKTYSDEELSSFIVDPPKKVFDFPCDSQNVERHIPLISKISEKLSENQRHGYILNKIASRKLNPSFKTKSDYNLN